MQEETEREIRELLVREILEDHSGVDTSQDIPLLSGLIDSFGLMTLLGFIEDTYGVSIGNDEIVKQNFESVSILAGFVERKLSEADGSGTGPVGETQFVGRPDG